MIRDRANMNAYCDEIYIGGTLVRVIEGEPLQHLQAGLYTGANCHGVMAAGLAADIRRAAGAEVERELRAHGDLLRGQAYLTSGGRLVERGVKAIAHGVVTSEPGGPLRLETAIAALLNGLRLLEDEGCRTVTIPQIGWRVSDLDQEAAAVELARVITTHLRRRSRLKAMAVVSRHRDYLVALSAALRELTTVTGPGEKRIGA